MVWIWKNILSILQTVCYILYVSVFSYISVAAGIRITEIIVSNSKQLDCKCIDWNSKNDFNVKGYPDGPLELASDIKFLTEELNMISI